MSKPNHYASSKPTVILYVDKDEQLEAVETETVDGKEVPKVFKNLSKAQKYMTQKIDSAEWPNIRFANESPVYGGGDRQETNNRRCLKCKEFLRPSGGQSMHNVEGIGQLAVVTYECPKCDLGEKQNDFA